MAGSKLAACADDAPQSAPLPLSASWLARTTSAVRGPRRDRSVFVSLRISCLQQQIPVLADNILAEAAPRLTRCQPKTGTVVDVASRGEHTVRPECNSAVALCAGKPNALTGQAGAKAAPTRNRID